MQAIHLNDEIDAVYGIGAAEFTASLPAGVLDIELHINSCGGSAFEGLAIYSALKQRSGTVRVVVDGLAASIASIIAMAASPGELVMAPAATMMIHEAMTSASGTAADLRKAAGMCESMSATLADVYSWRSGRAAGTWRELMAAETWFTPREACAAGLADRVLERVPA